MRSTSVRSMDGVAGLKAPPQGTPSTTSRNASTSRRPHRPGTVPAGPLSPPGVPSTPLTNSSALRKSCAPRKRSSSPETIVIEAGTFSTDSGSRVAVISRDSRVTSASYWSAATAQVSMLNIHSAAIEITFMSTFQGAVESRMADKNSGNRRACAKGCACRRVRVLRTR